MNVVLYEPDIPGNTGNVGRTCVGTQTRLYLVGKLGFSLNDKYLKRSGLDYWPKLDLKVHSNWDEFFSAVSAEPEQFYFFEKDAVETLWQATFKKDSYLIFGSETRGFPEEIRNRYHHRFHKIPMTGPIRSLNLSSAVAVALYEAIRQTENPASSVVSLL